MQSLRNHNEHQDMLWEIILGENLVGRWGWSIFILNENDANIKDNALSMNSLDICGPWVAIEHKPHP